MISLEHATFFQSLIVQLPCRYFPYSARGYSLKVKRSQSQNKVSAIQDGNEKIILHTKGSECMEFLTQESCYSIFKTKFDRTLDDKEIGKISE